LAQKLRLKPLELLAKEYIYSNLGSFMNYYTDILMEKEEKDIPISILAFIAKK